ncbi:SDR family NAD(P)-dependent oxidoreductase [Nocardia sp. NPDC049190]|uniref:SDR family NAD(P)-dependent oxidoreductase n=1 Tax=Nocardia sp. NPDC049190 TaxID=3155650 RepID=UPI0034109446
MPLQLSGKVAVVTGASRGVGKGVALELGAAGATVYLTGRTVSPGPLPGTITETAAEVTALGGLGIPVRCDHHDDDQVAALFAQVEAEQGQLDILVNNVFSAPDLAAWLHRSFWELPLGAWDQVLGIGLRSHYVACVYAAPLLFKAQQPGVVVNISSSGAVSYGHNVVYGVGKRHWTR